MKEVFITLGALFLLIIAVIGGVIGFFAYKGMGLDKCSKAYVEKALPSIVSGWKQGELMTRASPEFKAVASREDMEKLFKKLAELGAVTNIGEAEGNSHMAYTSQNGKRVTAEYRIPCEFENGKAEVKIGLIRKEAQWMILSFYVNSPIFLN